METAVTVAAVAKKVLEVVASNSKGRKFLGYTVGNVLILVFIPLIALVGLFGFLAGGEMPMNAHEIIAQLPAEDQAAIQEMNTNGEQIPAVFSEKGLSANDAGKAQAIYIACLFGKESDTLIADLADCFLSVTEDSNSLYDNIEDKFGVAFEESHRRYFDERYGVTCKNAIDTSGYADAKTKNAHDLAEWAKAAYAQNWGYVYGTYGSVLDDALLKSKASQYPNEVGGSDSYIRENWLGGRTADCVGLIKGYSWYDTESAQIQIGTNGMPDIGADTMYENAAEKGAIDAIPETPGLAVWHEGHIGIYIGNGEVIQAANTTAGVIKTKLADSGWTHWLKIPYISYP